MTEISNGPTTRYGTATAAWRAQFVSEEMSSLPGAMSSEGREFGSGKDSSPDAAWDQQDVSDNDDEYGYDDYKDEYEDEDDYEDEDIDSILPLSDRPHPESGEERLYLDAKVHDDRPPVTLLPNVPSIASASFLQLQVQVLQLFEAAQSQAVELRQRVDELEERNLEIVREGKEAYEVREAEILSRIEELTHEAERLSDELVSKRQDASRKRLLQEYARLVAKINAMRTEWTEKLSAISKEREEEMRTARRRFDEHIASLNNEFLAAVEKSVEDHPTTKALQAQNAELPQRLERLKEYITTLESKKGAYFRKAKMLAKDTPASDNLRKLYVADLNSELEKKLKEQDRIAKSQAAGMQQTMGKLRQQVAELERSHTTIEAGYSRAVYQPRDFESALVEVARLRVVVKE